MYKNELILAAACREFEAKRLARAQQDFSVLPQHSFSKSFERRMRALMGRMRGGSYHRLSLAARNILVAAVIAALIIGTAFSLEPVRDGIKDFFVANFGEYTALTFVDEAQDEARLKHSYGYLPSGFEKTKESSSGFSHALVYEDDLGGRILSKSFMDTNKIYINTENLRVETAVSDGIEYFCYGNADSCNLIFDIDGVKYWLSGNLPKEELVNMAKTLKK